MNTNQPRILYLVHTYGGRSGVELHTAQVARGLADRYQVAIAYPDSGRIHLRSLERHVASYPAAPVAVWPETPYRSPEHERALAEILATVRPDLIHIQHFACWPIGMLEQVLDSGARVVLSFADYYAIGPVYAVRDNQDPAQAFSAELSRKTFGVDITPYLLKRRNFIAGCLARMHALVAISPFIARQLLTIYPGPFRVIEYGIQRFQRLEPQDRRTELRFGYFGNLIGGKGWELLMEAFQIVRRKYPAAELHLYGGGEQPSAPHAGVTFHGAYEAEELSRLCAAIDVAVIPSVVPETYCMVLSEMWMAGLPVAVSDIGALGERVSDGINGKKFIPGDVGSIASTLSWFLEHDEWRSWRIPEPRLLDAVISDYDSLYRQVLASGTVVPAQPRAWPHSPVELRDRAYRCYQAGDAATAERFCRELLQQDPQYADAVYLLGVIAQETGRLEQAGELFRQSVLLAPDNAVFQSTLGEHHFNLNRQAEALACFRQAVALRPEYARAHNNLGRLLHVQDDLAAARASFAEAIRHDPRYAIAHNNLGAVLQAQKEFEPAAGHFRQALTLRPDYPEAQFNLGANFQAVGDPVAAAACFQEAVRLRPGYVRAHFHLGQVLEQQRRDYAALACYETAVRLEPENAEMQRRLGELLMLKKDWPAALAALERAATLKPGEAETFARLVYARQQVCDWRTYAEDLERLRVDADRQLAEGEATGVLPFQALTLPWPRPRLLAVAQSHSQAMVRHQDERGQLQNREHARTRTGRLRVGYLSGDFYDHPISHLVYGLFGRHDRDQFEVIAYSFCPPDDSVYRQRIVAGCEQFVEVAPLSIPALARRIADDGIHVLVDLMGYTGINRLGALALRPAPVQVSFLGMLGSMGADFIDYLITDCHITPPGFAADFTERFVTMPDSYLIAEPEASLPVGDVRRSDHGLPERGFVYCSFNGSYKLEPRMFGVWMKILAQTPGSVLWLFSAGPLYEENLRREATAHGVDPARLVFAKFVSRPEHILRHRAADLFLDTLLYNAAATASLALQAGLPVLTCPGETFASRVGASLLNAVGLPELVAPDLVEYERLAVSLAQQPEELERLRARLASRRLTAPLFDTPRFVRNLESAYEQMWNIHAAGQPPRAFNVTEPPAP